MSITSNVVIDNQFMRSNRISKVNAHTYQLMVEGVISIEGTFEQVRACAIGLEFDGVDEGMHAIIMNDHNCAIFGINRRFMYTSDRGTTFKQTKLQLVQ